MMNFFLFILLGICSYSQTFKTQNLQITGGTPALNKVLVSDTYGNVSWQSLGSLGYAAYEYITDPTGRVWLDRNLGASRVAQTMSDNLAYGDYYQWGRKADGHEKVTWTSNITASSTNGTSSTKTNTPDSKFILTSISDNDWRSNKDDNLWNYGSSNNPCPSGFRVPSKPELASLQNAYGGMATNSDAFSSPLHLPSSGDRSISDGTVLNAGQWVALWTSTPNGNQMWMYGYTVNYNVTYSFSRAVGLPIRCTKN